MAVTLQRVNMDTSWLVTLPRRHTPAGEQSPDGEPASTGLRVLLDPWLVGDEVDGARWFNVQVHATPPVPLADLGAVHAIVVSQPFADHCHEETLRLLDPARPIYAVPGAISRLRHPTAGLAERTLVPIPAYPQSVALPATPTAAPDGPDGPDGPVSSACRDCGSQPECRWHVSHLPASRWHLDLLHNALLFFVPASLTEPGGPASAPTVLYAPHGYIWRQPPKAARPLPRIDVLMCTLTAYRLPFFLGGMINLGLGAAEALVAACKPRVLIDTHSEQKPATGLVPWVAATAYPDRVSLDRAFPPSSIAAPRLYHLDTYAPCVLHLS